MTPITDHLSARLVDRYRIERELGAGGMATVYLAEDVRHHRLVAVKVLRPELAASLGAERFLREIEVTASLQHPHILALYDSGQADGLLYYVMPYVPGDSLRHRLRRERQLPVGDAVRIARGVASALAFAHRLGVVHRDIKPENVLLAEGEALVADFGIARAIAEAGGNALTSTGITVGTPTYMSPEQAAAERQLDGRSDIYALGCVLYEMLAGDAPYGGATAQVITARKLSDPVPSLCAIRESVPAALEAIVGRALAKAPADRFQTADELAAALDGVISAPHTATSALPGALDRQARWRQRIWQGVAAAGVVATAVLAWQASRNGPASRADDVVRRLTLTLPDSAPLAFIGEAPLHVGRQSLALSPDGRTLVYVGRYKGRTHLFVRPLEDERIRRLEGTEGAYRPFFSPDGKWVGFFARDTIRKVGLVGGLPVTLAHAPASGGAFWLPDGRILFSRDENVHFTVREGEGVSDSLHFRRHDGTWSSVLDRQHVIGRSTVYSLTDTTIWALTARGLERGSYPTPTDGQLAGKSAQPLPPDVIVAAIDGRLHGFRYDPASLRGAGPPVPLDDSVRSEGSADAQFTVGGDGTLVYAPGGDVSKSLLVVADRRGSVDTLPFPRAAYREPRYSPDGGRIAVFVDVANGSELRVLDLRDTTVLVAASRPGLFSTLPFWTADGLYLRFTDTVSMQVRATGGTPEKLQGEKVFWANSPDGRLEAWSDSTADLGWHTAIRQRGAPVQRFARFLYLPEISPDNRWISWMYTTDRGYEVFVSALPPGGPVFSVTPEGCVEQFWMPSSRELVCFRSDAYLYSVPLTIEGTEVRGGKPRRITKVPLLDTVRRSWALSPDGQRMLFLAAPAADTTTRLVVVTNYRREVERKLAEAQKQAPR